MSDTAGTEPAAPATAPGPLRGRLEAADRTLITGWALDDSRHDERVELEVFVDGESAGTLRAGTFRQDLLDNAIGDGAHAFRLYLPHGLSPLADHAISIRRRSDGAELRNSPITIPREEPAAETARKTITLALEAAAANATPAELDALIAFLAERAAQLLQERATPLPAPQAELIARWSKAAVTAPPDPRPRALFIDERVPDPDRDAGSNAAISHMRALQRLGYRVDFVAEHGLADADAANALQALDITAWQAPWIASVEEVLRRLGAGLAVVYLHRFGLMQRYAALARRWCPQARLLYCVADLHYLRLARRLTAEASGAMLAEGVPPEQELPEEAAGLRTAELFMALAADAVITHSSFERELLRRDVPEANVHLVRWEATARPTPVPFADRAGVAFVGSYGHGPNLDAALFLVEKIMPLVWAEDPTVPCLLAGSDLPASLRATAEAAPGRRVQVLGHVEKIAEVWERVRLSAAPLRYGAGLKGKVLDSFAAGIPCACSPMAAEGADLPRDLAGLVGDSAESLAAIILRLHNDAADNAAIARSGLDWVDQHLSAARIDAALAAAIGDDALAPTPSPEAGSEA